MRVNNNNNNNWRAEQTKYQADSNGESRSSGIYDREETVATPSYFSRLRTYENLVDVKESDRQQDETIGENS